jgi:hypothetical protein
MASGAAVAAEWVENKPSRSLGDVAMKKTEKKNASMDGTSWHENKL